MTTQATSNETAETDLRTANIFLKQFSRREPI